MSPLSQRSFDEHNLEQTIWHVTRSGGDYQHSIESFSLWDFDVAERIQRTKAHAKKENKDLPENMLDSQLLCYRCVSLFPFPLLFPRQCADPSRRAVMSGTSSTLEDTRPVSHGMKASRDSRGRTACSRT
jgi:hypothetical protein